MRITCLALAVAALLSISIDDATGDPFTARVYTDPSGKSLAYQLLIPAGYDKAHAYPLVLSLHGAGERGTNDIAQLPFVARHLGAPDFQSKNPCFVIAPQCPPDQQWVDMGWGELSGVRPVQPTPVMQLTLKLLDQITTEFNVDKNRIYVAGVSMGGYGSWDCITRHPELFAAGIVSCGGGDENTVTAAVAQVPVWVFHSDNDPTVPVVRARHMVAAMKKMGGQPRYTEFSGLGHDIGDKAYAEALPWLLDQRLDHRHPQSPKASLDQEDSSARCFRKRIVGNPSFK